MDREAIKQLILTLSLGYEFQMSDYASSKEREAEYEREGLAGVDKVVAEIEALISARVVSELEWVLSHGSGGGSWRLILTERIATLSPDKGRRE